MVDPSAAPPLVTPFLLSLYTGSDELAKNPDSMTSFTSVALSSTEVVEFMQIGKELPANLRAYYTPPVTFVIPDAPIQPSTAHTPKVPRYYLVIISATSLFCVCLREFCLGKHDFCCVKKFHLNNFPSVNTGLIF